MDRFLDEQENPNPIHRERSSSPNITSLIYGDPKRHVDLPRTPTQVDIPLIVEMVQKVVHPHELEKLSSELSTATAAPSVPESLSSPPVVNNATTATPPVASQPVLADLPNFTSSPPPAVESTVLSSIACTLTATATITTVAKVTVAKSPENCIEQAEAADTATTTATSVVRPAPANSDNEPSTKRLKTEVLGNDINCSAQVDNSHNVAIAEPDSPASIADTKPVEENNDSHDTSIMDTTSCKEHLGNVAVSISNINASVPLETKLRVLPSTSTSPPLTAE